jgi:hypothetical protein
MFEIIAASIIDILKYIILNCMLFKMTGKRAKLFISMIPAVYVLH